MYFDQSYILFILPALLIAIVSQIWITTSYSKYSKIQPKNGITGKEAGERIANGEGFPISIEISGGHLSDHFDPKREVVKLSTASNNSSIADIAVTAHEFGHVQQKYTNSPLFNIRMGLVPIVNIGSRIGYVLIIAGLILNILQLAEIGLIFFASTTIFALITIPIEIDATKRGLELIKKYDLLEDDVIPQAKAVLSAAAMTYVASLLTSLLNLLYYSSLIRRRS